ncbi:GLPGLI family protein [uncultured Lutibacter sp.]|uniref:GLPGLI family protein n=1 Tax=uncultured Lutibacter sp. TaxID=437739 RepID=UPI0026329D43|nr:GLPGLI family protein [uncultured Lutibacter sp.]
MKIKIIVLLLLFHCFAFSQVIINGSVVYNISLKTPDLNELSKNEKISKETRSKLIAMYKNVSDVSSILIFANDEALFEVENKMDNESNTGLNLTNLLSGGKGRYVFYYNNKTGENFIQKNAIGELYMVSESKKEWELTHETKKIGDYVCYKAIEQNKMEIKNPKHSPTIAWYAPSIPVNFGPNGYNGLPGLILELQINNKLIYRITKIELNPQKIIKIEKPTKGRKVTSDEFRKILENAAPEFSKKS